MDNKTILVTGGSGFIGSDFLRQFVVKYPSSMFINLDILTYAVNESSLDSISDCSNYRFIKGDICDKGLIEDLFESEDIDIVVNFAAQTHVDNSISAPLEFVETNINGTVNLLMSCLKYRVYFHQVSTDEVYGDLEIGSAELFNEDSLLNPSSPYSSSKASADLIVMSFYHTYNLDVTISRCSNNYGEYQNKEKLIPNVVDKIVNGKMIDLYGDGSNVRDWIYVSDHNKALELILSAKKYGEIYNIGVRNEVSNNDLVKYILDEYGLGFGRINYVSDRLGHDRRYGIDNAKLTLLGFSSDIDFRKKLSEVVLFYTSQR